MPKKDTPETVFEVEVQRTITTTVTVNAADAEAAARKVAQRDFPLPPYEDWSMLKDWLFLIRDGEGNDLYEGDGS